MNALTPDFEQAVHGLATEKNVVSIRNFGLAAGIELAPREGAIGQRGADAQGRAFHHGLLTRAPGDTLVLAPPFVSQPADIDPHALAFVLGDSGYAVTTPKDLVFSVGSDRFQKILLLAYLAFRGESTTRQGVKKRFHRLDSRRRKKRRSGQRSDLNENPMAFT